MHDLLRAQYNRKVPFNIAVFYVRPFCHRRYTVPELQPIVRSALRVGAIFQIVSHYLFTSRKKA
jgi:hypothetical protein